jgi:hypothetical protein
MPRQPRSFRPGVVYHLISRFVEHEWFITHHRERALYLKLLGRALARTDWRCLSYAIMSSHTHLAAVAGSEPLDAWIRRVHGPFAEAINMDLGRIGSLFVRGPRDLPVPDEHVGALIAYHHNNPVRAGVVKRAAESDWTSHRAFLGLAPRPRWLHVGEALSRAGLSSPAELDALTLGDPADPTRGERGLAIRFEECEEEDEPLVRASEGIDAQEILDVVAAVTNVSIAQLQSRRRDRTHAQARRVAVRCADAVGLKGNSIARALCVSQQRVSAILGNGKEASAVTALVKEAVARIYRK